MFKAEREFEFSGEATAVAALRSLEPELGKAFEKRSKTSIKNNKNIVSLKITAEDEQALKASLYSYSRLIGLCQSLSGKKVVLG